MKVRFAALAAAASLVAAQAMADTYKFKFTGSTTDFSGAIETSSTGSPELVTSIMGTLDGCSAILAPVNTIEFYPSNDNLIYPDGTGVGYLAGSSGF